MALEAACFKAFIPLRGDNDKQYEGLNLVSNYLEDVSCEHRDTVGSRDLKKLAKAIDSMRGKLVGTRAKKAVGAVGVVVVVAATGGLASYFAPLITPALAAALGAEVATLSGAALASESLVFLGGGAIATGGAGMAGGAIFIASGALKGVVSRFGIFAATNLALAMDASYILDKCAKLVTFSREVLIGKYEDFAFITEIHDSLSRRIIELDIRVEAIKRSEKGVPKAKGDDRTEKEKLSRKKMVKVLNRSLKFLKKCGDVPARGSD